MGSVMPVTNEVSAALTIMPPMTFLFSGLAVVYIASAAAGKPNIVIGNQPVMKMPPSWPAVSKKLVWSPNWNHTTVLRTWCRPRGMSRRLKNA